jgi:hypothetical protein
MHIRAAIADVNRAVRREAQRGFQLLDDSDLPVPRRHTRDGLNFAGRRVVLELGAVDVIGRHHTRQGRLDDFARRRRNDEKRKPVVVEPSVQEVDESRDVFSETHPPTGFNQMFLTNAPEFRVVTNQVRELTALLDQVGPGEPVDFFLEPGDSNQLAHNQTRIVEAKRLIEIGRQQKSASPTPSSKAWDPPYCNINISQ